MKFLMMGAGGTGAILGAQLVKAGEDVTFIARNAHLEAMQREGLRIKRLWNNTEECLTVKACAMEAYDETPDVIIVCVKSYSVESVVPFLNRVAAKDTVVIPVLNGYGHGSKLQAMVPEADVLDGCTYLYADIEAPGVIVQRGKICRLLFGPRDGKIAHPRYEETARAFAASGIDTVLSDHIQRDVLQKFSYVSPVGATGLYFDACAEAMQQEGEARTFFIEMVGEVAALAAAMGHPFEKDVVRANLAVLDGISPDAITSLQRDILAGHMSEIDGLLHEVVEWGKTYGVDMPKYALVSADMHRRGY